MAIPKGTPAGLTQAQLNAAQSAQWKQAVKQALVDTRCSATGFLVEDMDVDSQTVTVQISIQERVRQQTGTQWWDIPPIGNVPVVMPRGGGYACTLPLKQGDEGLLVFCDTCFDSWWLNGQTNAPKADNVDTPSGSQRQFEVRRHYVHDCGFIPGMWSQKSTLISYDADNMQIRSDDATQMLELADLGMTINTSQLTITAASGPITQNGEVSVNGNLKVSSGATGTFSTPTGQVVTVQNGVVISIV